MPISQLAIWPEKKIIRRPAATVRSTCSKPRVSTGPPGSKTLIFRRCGYSATTRPRLSHMPATTRAISVLVAAVETLDPRPLRFRLKEPWPDFLSYYASATGAGWIVPKKYVEKVGDDGYKKAPIGAGPYKFASFSPGVELVFEAFEPDWRKIPSVKRLFFKVILEETTRLAALKTGEVDIVYAINGELAKELRNMPGLTLKPVYPPGPFWLYFPEQWDATSPWHDERVRRAANLAIDRNPTNEALPLGFSNPPTTP